MQGTFFEDSVVATWPGWRTDFLTQMGFVIPDAINAYARDDHRAFIPREEMVAVLDTADVLIWTTESDEETAALAGRPGRSRLQGDRQTRNVFTGKELAGAIAFASPLSYPVVADRLPPQLAQAAGLTRCPR